MKNEKVRIEQNTARNSVDGLYRRVRIITLKIKRKKWRSERAVNEFIDRHGELAQFMAALTLKLAPDRNLNRLA
jgi:hypothetical protein